MRQLNNQNYESASSKGMYNSTPAQDPNVSAIQQEQALLQSKSIRKDTGRPATLGMSSSGGPSRAVRDRASENNAGANPGRAIRGAKQKLSQLVASPRSGELRKRSQELKNKSYEITQTWTQHNSSLEETRVITAPYVLRHELRKKPTPKNTLNHMLNTSDTQSPTNNSSCNHITTGSTVQR